MFIYVFEEKTEVKSLAKQYLKTRIFAVAYHLQDTYLKQIEVPFPFYTDFQFIIGRRNIQI
jgi:hypothetical protein